MCDIAEIQNVLVRQKMLVDARDAEALRDCYTEDMSQSLRFNGGQPQRLQGRDAVLTHMKGGWETTDSGASDVVKHVHFVGPAEVNVTGADRAAARSMCLYLSAADGRVVGWGQYSDGFARVDGNWRLCSRSLEATFV